MNELGAQFNRHGKIRFATRQDSPTDARACFHYANGSAAASERLSSRQSRRTRTDHDDIKVSHWIPLPRLSDYTVVLDTQSHHCIERAMRNKNCLSTKSIPSVLLGFFATICSLNSMAAEPGTTNRPWMNTQLSAERRADKLVAAMTQEEKLLLLFGYLGATFPENCAAPQPCYHPPQEALEGSAGYIPGIARLGVPAQWQTDASLGVATQVLGKIKRERTALPSGIASAASWNPDLAYAGGAMIGDEARRSGFNVMLAGGVNLLREPRNGR